MNVHRKQMLKYHSSVDVEFIEYVVILAAWCVTVMRVSRAVGLSPK